MEGPERCRRLRTDHAKADVQSIVFVGIVTSKFKQFSGNYERNAVKCLDIRWLLHTTSPIFGQVARGPDDFEKYGTDEQVIIEGAWTFLSAQRCIFNPDGKPNRDPVDLIITSTDIEGMEDKEQMTANIPIFCDPGSGEAWTAKQMLTYIMSPAYNLIFSHLPIFDPSQIPTLNHSDWNKKLYNINIDGLSILEAIDLICRHIGWTFRLSSNIYYVAFFEFYKPGKASGYSRSSEEPTIQHELCVPAVGTGVKGAVIAGNKLLAFMVFEEDVSDVINNPWAIGSPHRFEFTAKLVPAWLDSQIEVDTDNLYFTEAALQKETNPEQYAYYRYYHVRGSQHLRTAGRKWSLNESGIYTGGEFNRGIPFDFTTIVPEEYIMYIRKEGDTKKAYAPYRRQLLPCLTLDKEHLNSIGIIVEFSFDEGSTWQIIPCSIIPLSDECGIYIAEENLCEMVDQNEGIISGGILDGEQLNYWTSLCDDIAESRSFKAGEWKTRVRITASVQMDQRIFHESGRQPSSALSYESVSMYDFSDKYGHSKRTESSIFVNHWLTAPAVDSTETIKAHINAIRDANQDISISDQFILDRLWLGDGAGQPDFMVGDTIKSITGRDYNLSTAPEIIKVVYLPEKQQTELITRDSRYDASIL